jgi:large subunit ribosomal protein L19
MAAGGDGTFFAGVCLNIRRRGADTGILLRNELQRTPVEMWFKVFAPTVEAVEVVQRRAKRARRARLYYMRYVSFYHTLFFQKHATHT